MMGLGKGDSGFNYSYFWYQFVSFRGRIEIPDPKNVSCHPGGFFEQPHPEARGGKPPNLMLHPTNLIPP